MESDFDPFWIMFLTSSKVIIFEFFSRALSERPEKLRLKAHMIFFLIADYHKRETLMHSNSFYAAYKKYIFMYTIWNSSNQKWWTQLILDNVSVGVVPNEPKVIYMYHACIYTIFFKTPCIILFCWLTMQITNFSLYIIKSSVLQSKAMHIKPFILHWLHLDIFVATIDSIVIKISWCSFIAWSVAAHARI